MHNIPWFSTFTLATETLVTISVIYILYSGYYKNKFPARLAGLTLGYEIFFNISYMASRALSHVDTGKTSGSPLYLALAIFHGSFSLLMFILLLIFMYYAWKSYKQGINFFQTHKKLTIIFLTAWMIAILSGFAFYYIAYFK